MRLAFMGTPDFAVPSLAELIASGHEIVAVYSQPPRPKGRGQKLTPSPVHAFADEPAKRVLVRAIKTGRAPLRLLPPLVLHAMWCGSSELLNRWQMAMPPAPLGCAYLNFTASHDGIGVRGGEGLAGGDPVGDEIRAERGAIGHDAAIAPKNEHGGRNGQHKHHRRIGDHAVPRDPRALRQA